MLQSIFQSGMDRRRWLAVVVTLGAGLPILDVVIHPLPYTESTPERVTYPRGAR